MSDQKQIVPVPWDDERQQIGIKFRKSTLKAMSLLDRNRFHTRTAFLSRITERYLQKVGLLSRKPADKVEE